MIKEVDLFGVFIPPLIAYAVIAALVWQPLRMVLERAGFYRAVWHPALFNLGFYALTLAGVVALLK